MASQFEGTPSQPVIVAEAFWTGDRFDFHVQVSARLNHQPEDTRHLFVNLIAALIEAQEQISHNKRTYDAMSDPTARTSNADV